MSLNIIGTETTDENINRGICAAQDFLDQHLIIPYIVYKNVQLKAEGKPHIQGMVELWNQVQNIAIDAAFCESAPEGCPALVCDLPARISL